MVKLGEAISLLVVPEDWYLDSVGDARGRGWDGRVLPRNASGLGEATWDSMAYACVADF